MAGRRDLHPDKESKEPKSTSDDIKSDVDQHFNHYFRKEILPSEEVRNALEKLKTKLMTENKLDSSEIENIARYLHTSFADYSETSNVIATIEEYIHSGRYDIFKTTLLSKHYEKGSRFFHIHEEKITILTEESQKNISTTLQLWQSDMNTILKSKYKNADSLSNSILWMLSHLSPIWIGKNDSLIRNSRLTKDQLTLQQKATAKEIEGLYHLIKDIISLPVKKEDQLRIVINLLDILRLNIQEYPGRSIHDIHNAMATLCLGHGTECRKTAPDFGAQLNKLAAKYYESSGPVATAKKELKR